MRAAVDPRQPALLARCGKISLDDRRTRITANSARPARTIVDMVKWLDERGIELADIRIKRPSLEEACIELTGKSLRE